MDPYHGDEDPTKERAEYKLKVEGRTQPSIRRREVVRVDQLRKGRRPSGAKHRGGNSGSGNQQEEHPERGKGESNYREKECLSDVGHDHQSSLFEPIGDGSRNGT